MPENHSHTVPGGRGHWWTEGLWRAAADLPVQRVAIADVAEVDTDCWFRGAAPTLRQVADHARRIEAADLSYPIILSASGGLMDGGHRLARALIDGHTHVDAVRFDTDPAPDWFVPD